MVLDGDLMIETPKKISLDVLDELMDLVADLDHKRWKRWSRKISDQETISKERMDRWRALWDIEYKDLPMKQKI